MCDSHTAQEFLSVAIPRVPRYVVASLWVPMYKAAVGWWLPTWISMYVATRAIALPAQSVDNNSNQTRTHISQNRTSVHKAKTLLRRREHLNTQAITINYPYGGNVGLEETQVKSSTVCKIVERRWREWRAEKTGASDKSFPLLHEVGNSITWGLWKIIRNQTYRPLWLSHKEYHI